MKTRFVAGTLIAGAAALAAVLVLPEPVYSHKPITTNILFKNEIAQIFQRKCFQCHSENNLAMSLTTYTEARPWARAIREEILDRQMPPWQTVSGYGRFANDISLNSREKEIILSWTDGGAPSGVLKVEESIPPVYVPPAPEWELGEPDQVLPIGDGHAVASYAPFEVKRFVVSTGLTSPKRVRAIALKQGDRRVVRHAAFYDEGTGKWLGAWTPWQTVSQLAGGAAIQLPANAQIRVEIGYVGGEADVTDKSELGLYFAEGQGPVADAMSFGTEVSLDPGAEQTRVQAQTTLKADTTAYALWPMPAVDAGSIEITAITPEGIVTPLLWIQDYLPEWRSPYVFSEPVALPRGTRLIMTAYVDNPGEEARAGKAEAWILTAPSPRTSRSRE